MGSSYDELLAWEDARKAREANGTCSHPRNKRKQHAQRTTRNNTTTRNNKQLPTCKYVKAAMRGI